MPVTLLCMFGLFILEQNKNKNMQCKKERVQCTNGPLVLTQTSQK